jgi:hypothetical protein
MLPILLEEVNIQVRNVYKMPALVWTKGIINDDDLKRFETAVIEGTQFDPLHLKKTVWDAYKKGEFIAHVIESPLARVVALLPKGKSIPDSWGRIFQMFGTPKHGSRWNVYMFGGEVPRLFPKDGAPLAAEHLNGGYTTGCSTDGIFIYRIEEATRVLIHELLHAACQDPYEKSVPQREATIETWAELILIAFCSKGIAHKAEHLLRLQTQWVADTNLQASKHNVKSEADYGWRYLNGRVHVYQALGLELPSPSGVNPERSRFTHPELGD